MEHRRPRRQGRRGGKGNAAPSPKALKNARWALWHNEDDLTEAQRAKLAWIEALPPLLHRAWALKEGLRWVFSLAKGAPAAGLDRWLSWARRCRIPEFVQLAGGKVGRHRQAIEVSIDHGLNNELVESTNTKTTLIARQRSGSATPLTHSSAWPCSPSAHTSPHFPAAPDTHHAAQREQRGPGVRVGSAD